MRVKMLSGNQTGQVIDMPRHEAEANITTGLAEALSAAPTLIGANVYELADGTRIRGKRKAMAAAAELVAG